MFSFLTSVHKNEKKKEKLTYLDKSCKVEDLEKDFVRRVLKK